MHKLLEINEVPRPTPMPPKLDKKPEPPTYKPGPTIWPQGVKPKQSLKTDNDNESTRSVPWLSR